MYYVCIIYSICMVGVCVAEEGMYLDVSSPCNQRLSSLYWYLEDKLNLRCHKIFFTMLTREIHKRLNVTKGTRPSSLQKTDHILPLGNYVSLSFSKLYQHPSFSYLINQNDMMKENVKSRHTWTTLVVVRLHSFCGILLTFFHFFLKAILIFVR